MTIFNCFFLIPLFIIGIICSYTDVRYGVIRNKWVGLGFLWVFILYVSLFIFNSFFFHQSQNSKLIIDMVINGSIAVVLGYILWNFKLLAAGDAKLFALYAFLIPPEFYSKAYFLHFPSISLLINIFIPLLLFLAIKAFIFYFKKTIKEGSIKMEKIVELLPKLSKFFVVYINFVIIFIIIQLIIREFIRASGNIFSSNYSVYLFIVLFFAYRFIFSFLARHKFINLTIMTIGFPSFFYLWINGQSDFLSATIKVATVFIVFINILQQVFRLYIKEKEVKRIDILEIKEGFFPFFENLEKDLADKLGVIEREGLTEKQVETIKKFLKDNPEKEIKVYKTFALAPFIFLAALICVLTQNSFLSFLAGLFGLLYN